MNGRPHVSARPRVRIGAWGVWAGRRVIIPPIIMAPIIMPLIIELLIIW